MSELNSGRKEIEDADRDRVLPLFDFARRSLGSEHSGAIFRLATPARSTLGTMQVLAQSDTSVPQPPCLGCRELRVQDAPDHWMFEFESEGRAIGVVQMRSKSPVSEEDRSLLEAWLEVHHGVLQAALELVQNRWERSLLLELSAIQSGRGCLDKILVLLRREFGAVFLGVFEVLDLGAGRFRFVSSLVHGLPRSDEDDGVLLNGICRDLYSSQVVVIESGLTKRIPSVKQLGELGLDSYFGALTPDVHGNGIGRLLMAHDTTLDRRDLPEELLTAIAVRVGSELSRHRGEERRLATERRNGQAHRLRSLALFAGGLSHEVNNLMMTVRANTEMALAEYGNDSQLRERLEEVRGASRQAALLTSQLLAFVGRGAFDSHVTDLTTWLERWASLAERSTPAHVQLVTELSEYPMPVALDSVGFFQALTEVLTNSLEELGAVGGRILVSSLVEHVDLDRLQGVVSDITGLRPGRFACISLTDSGKGLTLDARAHAFDPFFTTKEQARGLGLSITAGILRDLGGCVAINKFTDAAGAGLRVDLWLPISEQEVTEPEDEVVGGLPTRVLLVEDEPPVRMAVRLLLEHLGIAVVEAESGAVALEYLDRPDHGIELVIADLVMPRMDGASFLRRARAKVPDLAALLMSGFHEGQTTRKLEGLGPLEVLQKPFSIEDIDSAIRRSFARGPISS